MEEIMKQEQFYRCIFLPYICPGHIHITCFPLCSSFVLLSLSRQQLSLLIPWTFPLQSCSCPCRMLGQFDSGSWAVPAGQQFEKYSDSFISLMEAGGRGICNHKLLPKKLLQFEFKEQEWKHFSILSFQNPVCVQVTTGLLFPTY